MIGETYEERERRKRALLDKLVDEVVETPKGLMFKKHYDDENIEGWYVIF